jgi:RNA polymerase sigma-70 factor (ECF subfamily)
MPTLRARPELLAAFRRGERAALETVYWEYVALVERVVRRGHTLARTGTRVEGAGAEVADLVQEVFIRAFAERARLAYDGLRDYGPYLVTIARNLMTDWARKRGRELAIEDGEEALAALADPSTEADAAGDAWADEATMRLVENYLASLDESLRAVHGVRYDQGLSQEKAAEVLGCSRQQLRTREAKLREGLKRALSKGSKPGAV